MAIELYDLCGADDVRFSPYCWRIRLALAHKQLEPAILPVAFTDIADILDGSQKKLPVIRDGDAIVSESFDIALYLEKTYPDRPSLFGGESGVALSRFIENWTLSLHKDLASFVARDIWAALQEKDRAYFRASREKRFGQSLEAHQEGRENRLAAFHEKLLPLRSMLQQQPFFGGDAPLYADYILFGSLQWPRIVSSFAVLPPEDDAVTQWFRRCAALFGGLGEKAKPTRLTQATIRPENPSC